MYLEIYFVTCQTVGLVLHLNSRHKLAKYFQFVSSCMAFLFFIGFFATYHKTYDYTDLFGLGFGLMFLAITLPIYSGAFLLMREKQTQDLIDFVECQRNECFPTPDMQWANSLRLRLKVSYWAWIGSISSLFLGGVIDLLKR